MRVAVARTQVLPSKRVNCMFAPVCPGPSMGARSVLPAWLLDIDCALGPGVVCHCRELLFSVATHVSRVAIVCGLPLFVEGEEHKHGDNGRE